MKEQVIQIPDTVEVKEIKDGKIILVEKKKKLTYEDVAKELFSNPCFYINTNGCITSTDSLACFTTDLTNCTSSKQAEKLLAINQLMNVAKYLNGDWQPDWKGDELKYYIEIDTVIDDLCFDNTSFYNGSIVYFKSKKLIKQAIEILGEDTIRLALCTDY